MKEHGRYFKLWGVSAILAVSLLGLAGCRDNVHPIKGCPTDDTAALVAHLGMGASCILEHDKEGNQLIATRGGGTLLDYTIEQDGQWSDPISTCAAVDPFVMMHQEDEFCTDGKSLYVQGNLGQVAGAELELANSLDQQLSSLKSYLEPDAASNSTFLPLVLKAQSEPGNVPPEAGSQIGEERVASDEENEPLSPMAIVGLAAIAALGFLSSKVIRDLLDSPRAKVARVLDEASNLPPDQVGLHVKKNILDEVPKLEAAYNSVNSFLNALTFGYLRRLALEELDDAKVAAELAKKAMNKNTVGKIKAAKTILRLITYSGAIASIGGLFYSVMQSDK